MKIKALLLLLFFSVVVFHLMAQQFALDDFRLDGSAYKSSNNCFSLVPDRQWVSGSIWYKEPIDLREPFDLELDVFLGCRDSGADGIVVVFATDYQRTGYRGEGMGFAGLFPSLGVELDTYYNYHRWDPEGDHIALLSQGEVSHHGNLAGPKTVPNLEDCKSHNLKISWNPASQMLKVLLDGRTSLNYKGNLIEDVFFGTSTIYWGMTAGTGRYSNRHEFCIEELNYSNPAESSGFDPITKNRLLKGEMISLEKIQFTSGSTDLTEESRRELDKLSQFLKKYSDRSISIYGHTDSAGNAKTNQQLSDKRVEKITDYLESKGVAPKRIQGGGYGEKFPKASNATSQGRKENRRIDILVFKAQA